jgi:hypothetical protein
MKLSTFVVIVLEHFAIATPQNESRRLIFCDTIVNIVAILKVNRATQFCPSYLQISTVTTTAVKTALILDTVQASTPTTAITITMGTK